MTPTQNQRVSVRSTITALAIDAVLVTIFAAIGRASHDESPVEGLFTTAWPFLAGLAIAWVAMLAWRNPIAITRVGIPVWLLTVALGMAFRIVSGQGTALPFIIVATITLGLLLLGWRLIAGIVLRKRAATADSQK